MLVSIGRTPVAFYVPKSSYRIELRKLSGPAKADAQEMIGRNAPASTQARFAWDSAVVGFRLPSDRGEINWPAAPERGDVKEQVWQGMDEDILQHLLFAFWAQNDLHGERRTIAYLAALGAGRQGVPASVWGWIQGGEEPSPEDWAKAESQAAALVGDLGNAWDGWRPAETSSGTSAAPDDAPTTETATE